MDKPKPREGPGGPNPPPSTRHGVEDDEHQDDGQQLADEAEEPAAVDPHAVEDDEHQAADDERAEEPDRTGGRSSVHTLKDLGSPSGHASELRFYGDMNGPGVASDALVL